MELYDQYNTALTDEQRALFNSDMGNIARATGGRNMRKDISDYDIQGYWLNELSGYGNKALGKNIAEPPQEIANYFSQNPQVAGMYDKDSDVIYRNKDNAYSQGPWLPRLEAARGYMYEIQDPVSFDFTPEQEKAYSFYSKDANGSMQPAKESMLSRAFVGDNTLGQMTPEQIDEFNRVSDYIYSQVAQGHLPDTYKKPNHMTFSDHSIYSTPETLGGHWDFGTKMVKVDVPGQILPEYKDRYTPSDYVLWQHSPAEMREYFRQYEPNSILEMVVSSDWK